MLACCEKVEEVPSSWGPGPRTQTPSDGKGPPKLLPPAQDQCSSPFKPQLETTGFTCTSIHLAGEALVKDLNRQVLSPLLQEAFSASTA